MSSSILKKSLELVDSDYERKSKVFKQEGSKKVYSKLKLFNKKKLKNQRGVADVRKKNLEAIEKIRRVHKKSLNEQENQGKVKLLHKPVNDKILSELLKHLGASKDRLKEKEKVEEKTAFTEEDFIKFEKEYFAD